MSAATDFAAETVATIFGQAQTEIDGAPDRVLTTRDMLRKLCALSFDAGQLHTMRIAKTGFETMAEIALGGKKESI